jgi:hypothetical protein
MNVFMSHVNAHHRVNLAEKNFSNQVDKMLRGVSKCTLVN